MPSSSNRSSAASRRIAKAGQRVFKLDNSMLLSKRIPLPLNMPTAAESEPRVSIVVPVYNEALRLPVSLARMAEHFSRWDLPHEILIVVEHSTDGTLDLAFQATAKQANFRVIDNSVHRGKGYAVRSGVMRARGAFIFYMDV